jgi:hypothetical protein
MSSKYPPPAAIMGIGNLPCNDATPEPLQGEVG